jgi:hypothetical protein
VSTVVARSLEQLRPNTIPAYSAISSPIPVDINKNIFTDVHSHPPPRRWQPPPPGGPRPQDGMSRRRPRLPPSPAPLDRRGGAPAEMSRRGGYEGIDDAGAAAGEIDVGRSRPGSALGGAAAEIPSRDRAWLVAFSG